MADEHGAAIIRKIEPATDAQPDRFERLRGSLNLGMTTDEFMALIGGDD